MTAIGVREAVAGLPTWRWAALYIGAYLVALLLNTTSRVSGSVVGAAIGYGIAGPWCALLGLLIGAATQHGPAFSLLSLWLDNGAARLSSAVNLAAATVADLAAEESAEVVAGVRI
ncbi:MAG: hypothetical protein ACRDZY_00750 [Acidimicrobiales bacterium]